MKKSHLSVIVLSLNFLFFIMQPVHSQRIMEKLDRGLIAISKGNGQIYVGWRLLGNDFPGVTFNLYQSVNGGAYNQVNTYPMKTTTDTLLQACNLSVTNSFFVKAILKGKELPASKIFTLPANAPVRNQFSAIALKPVPGFFRTINGQAGDIDGDGEYELFVMREEYFNPYTTSEGAGDTARMMLDCYKLNGDFVWRYEFGKNIKSEMQNCAPCYVVGDFDGNGKAEVCVRASELSVFQSGTPQQRIIGDYLKPDGITLYPYYPGRFERIGSPEFMYMLKGETGEPLDSIPYKPEITSQPFVFWGLNERPFYEFMSMAYLDGKLPSIVTLRGLGESQPFKINSFDFRNGHFTLRPDSFSTVNTYNAGLKYYTAVPDIAFGGHSIRIKDIDNDGRDEVIVTGAVFDHDLKLLYTQSDRGLNHGDSYQILDMDPDRPGLEYFSIQQNNPNLIGAAIWKAEDGNILHKFLVNNVVDPSRGEAACIIPEFRGAQCYGGTPGMMDYKGNFIGDKNFIPCTTVYWDADPAKEIGVNNYTKLDGYIQKFDYKTNTLSNFISFKTEGCESKSIQGPVMIADLMGDWREEFILETNDQKALKIYTTSIPSNQRIYTLMHNPGYRTQTTCFGRIGGFYTDYYLGPQMTVYPPSAYVDEDICWNENPVIVSGKKILFADDVDGTYTAEKLVSIADSVSPSAVYVAANADYIFRGNGKLTGDMPVVKTGKGKLVLENIADYKGNTEIYNGTVVIQGKCNSPVNVYGDVWSGVASSGKSGSVLAGNGILMSDLKVYEKGAVSPGNTSGKVDTLTIAGNLQFMKRSYAVMDIPSKSGESADFIDVKGTFILKDTMTILLNPLTAFPAEGEFPLIRFTQSQISKSSAIFISGLEGRLCEVYYTPNQIGIRFLKTRANTGITWAGTGSDWNAGISQNWMKGSVQDVFIPNDSVIFDNTGIAQHSVVLKDVLPVSGWNVSSSGNYTFTGAGNIAGTGGLLKSGTGKLSIFTSNSFTGKVNLNGGITEVNSINDKGVPGSFGASDAISINGGTLMLSQKTISTNRNMQIGAKGAVLTVADSRFQCLLEGIISGEGTIVKNGPGNLLLASGNNFSGGITINEGNVILAGKTGNVGGPGSGLITLNGGSLIMSDVQQSETVPWAMNVPEGKTAGFQPDGRCFLTGSLTGGGTLNMLIPYIRTEFRGNWSAFSGTINLTYNSAYDSHFRINNTFGYPLATFNLTQNAKMYRVITGSVTVGSVTSASATAELATTDGSGRTTNWIVGSNNKDATFAGLISGPGTITKTGSGMWVLTNANTVSGDIFIQGGKLIANNLTGSATGAGKIFVNNSGTLAGSGIIDGVVQVAQGGNITSGLTTPGTLTLNNDLILQAGAKTTIKITSLKNDKIIVGGKIVLDGILEMMKLGIVLKAGDSFTIFQAPSISGQFDSIIPAYPGTGLKWNLSRISEGIVGVDTEDALPGLSENIIKVYPTRVDSFCNLEFNGLTGKILVEILDAGGEMMMSELITINENIHSLKMNHLSAGVYVMNFKYKNEIFQKRIVKL